ncbi:MAG: lamin tail domain-containing protein [bacterium]
MKKIITLIFSLAIITTLSACGKDEVVVDLLFSEYVEGAQYSKAVEIYNPLDKAVDLSKYSIGVYKDGQTLKTYDIKLEGTLESKGCYVVAYNESSQELLEKADLITEDLYFTGDDPIVLFNGTKTISTLGLISSLSVVYGRDTTMVKLDADSNIGNNKYIKSDWIEYVCDEYQYLGTTEHDITLEDLLAGPQLIDEWLNTPFFPEGTTSTNFLTRTGTGGAEEVKLKYHNDGDTTIFYYPESWDYLNLDETENRLRYFGIDTPESSSSVAPDPWGKTASAYVEEILKNATTIHIQSVEGYTVSGSFNRLLGLVWVDGVLLQNEIIKMGYSEFTHSTLPFGESNFPITSYLKYNANLAELKGLAIWGQKDPTWNYDTNLPL